ncbi:hypothetical protein D3C80_1697430 [compost metagenome]
MLQLLLKRNQLPSPAQADLHQLGQLLNHFRGFDVAFQRAFPINTLQSVIQKMRIDLLIQQLQLGLLLLQLHLVFIHD